MMVASVGDKRVGAVLSNGDDIVLEHWEYAGGAGSVYVPKEIRKAGASLEAVSKVERAMKRLEDGTARPAETDLVRDGVYELRVQADKRWYRLLWGRDGDSFIALQFMVKKTNKLPNDVVKNAIKRLKAHKA